MRSWWRLQVLRALIETYASEVGSREVGSLVSDLLPILIDKAGDNNTRIRCHISHAYCRHTHTLTHHVLLRPMPLLCCVALKRFAINHSPAMAKAGQGMPSMTQRLGAVSMMTATVITVIHIHHMMSRRA